MLLVVELLIRWVPLPRLAAVLGAPLGLAPAETATTAAPELDERSWRRVALSRRLVQRWPWGSGPCLRESLVIGHLLRHRDPVLRVGVARDGEHLWAHAWLEVDGAPLYGAEGFQAFEVLPAEAR